MTRRVEPQRAIRLSPVEAVTNEVLAQGLPARLRLSLGTAARHDLRGVERAVDRVLPFAEHALTDRIRVRHAAMARLAVSRPARVHAARQRALDVRRARRHRSRRWSQ